MRYNGIEIVAPDEITRDAEIDRLKRECVEEFKMPCGSTVSMEEIPKEWGRRACPCGNPFHTLWEVARWTDWVCPKCDSGVH